MKITDKLLKAHSNDYSFAQTNGIQHLNLNDQTDQTDQNDQNDQNKNSKESSSSSSSIFSSLIEKSDLYQNNNHYNHTTFSFEFFPPKTSQGVQNLYDRIDRMYNLNPLFIDITWNAGGKVSKLTNQIVNVTQSILGLETCMHLTCTNMSIDLIDNALLNAYSSGCQNILALRGDPPINDNNNNSDSSAFDNGKFKYAKDLIKYIRSKYGDYFCIGVAGYPEGHPEESDSAVLLSYLKQKIDAGGDFIITQMFYDVDNFLNWCNVLKNDWKISVPIIPGIMPISTYSSFIRRATWSHINIPDSFLSVLKPFKDDDAKIKELGAELITEMCRTLIDSNLVNHLHFYTMNLESSTISILEKLNLLNNFVINNSDNNENDDYFPWRKSLNPSRSTESIRPIFWQNKKFNYFIRTKNWDEFPNGRWGNSNSPAFGEIDLFNGSLLRHSSNKILKLWDRPTSLNNLIQLFIDYLNGKLSMLPWCDSPINSLEISDYLNNLIDLNFKGILTVNSQPKINGVKSTSKIHGWGPRNGFIYKKQYLEFFLPKTHLNKLINKIQTCNDILNNNNSNYNISGKNNNNKNDDYNILSFFAVDNLGTFYSNLKDLSKANAVTWGIFPNCEVIQPTIVEKVSFLAWKDEAYKLTEEWLLIYKNQNSQIDINKNENEKIYEDNLKSQKVLRNLIDNYVLVNIVDNDYVGNEKIFSLFDDFNCLEE
ncbi:methylenetetrahydrofolate reductase (NAD(P)H) MET13 [Ascoidea rubescens DSM 1968]|uniref:Methylenetetrahydrofolate reduct n=1 Tax=Ascoidea rubescens DSM 1968 TaxID=1344418 RepID=A0A1D2V8L2_9ASCO|nr:methylenetetrahydrofolate reduct [Ascoidea rubescens DSM 1968]ODV57970.1 methylenetetrahydrofolate reduct [Ascoidea rubescens DSM 1968]